MQSRSLLFSLLFLLMLAPARPQGPDPAKEKVIRPGKLIGAPKEASPPGGDPTTGETTRPGDNGTKPNEPGRGGAGGTGTGTPGVLTPPTGVTAGEGLRVVRWTTFRRITRFTQTDLKYMAQVRLSTDGSKIVFGSAQGTYTLNADGSNLVRVSEKANNNPGVVDISADGQKIFWTDINEREAFVANSDGTNRVKLPVTTYIISARMTADGKRVLLLSPEAGGILSVPSDGSDLKRIMTTAQVCKLNGVGENGNHWRGGSSGLDISADGSRVVFHLLWDAFAMNGDGSGLRQLTQYLMPEDRNMNLVRVSGDGKRIATYHQVKGLEIRDWDGGNVVVHSRDPNLFDGRSLQFTTDGSKLAMGTGLWLFDGAGPGKLELGEWGCYGDHPLFETWGATLSGDGQRACVVVKYQGLQQLTVVDFNPRQLEGIPILAQMSVFPRFILTDGTNAATATVRVTGGPAAVVGISGMRDGFRLPEWNLRPWGGLNDEGRSGDTKANDGVFSTAGVQLFKPTPKDAAPGPITLRYFVWDKENRALVVDVEGFQARTP